jgi:hypothetical protein
MMRPAVWVCHFAAPLPPNSHTLLLMMRRALAVQTCLAIVLAFLFAPFQHAHPAGSDHRDARLVHAHFYHFHFVSPQSPQPDGTRIDADDDDHARALPLDTFKLRHTSTPALSLPSRSLLVAASPERAFGLVEIVEERGHGPPGRDASAPRAPPV